VIGLPSFKLAALENVNATSNNRTKYFFMISPLIWFLVAKVKLNGSFQAIRISNDYISGAFSSSLMANC
jgi:hypothetical protein